MITKLVGLVLLVLALGYGLTGCIPRPLVVGCVDQKPYNVSGPVFVNKDAVMFLDEDGKIHKIEGTCGIRAVHE